MHIPFTRTRTTWLGYGFLAYFTLSQALISAIMPFLRVEIGLSYTLTGMFMSANALGMALAGLSGDTLAGRLGRRRVFWCGVAGSLAGLAALAFGRLPALLLSGSFFAGYFGALIQVMIQAFLSDADAKGKAIALTEAGIAGGIGSFLGPFIVSAVVLINLGWRVAPALIIVIILLATLGLWKAPIPAQRSFGGESAHMHTRLPGVYWVLWIVIYLSVAVEWSVIFWSADYLEKIVGVEKTLATSALSAYFVAVIIGRIFGSRLVRRFRPLTLLLCVQALAGVGILVFLFSTGAGLHVMGLVVTGLGIASLYPLTSIDAIGCAPDAANMASARLTLSAGIAIFTAPLFMGWVADQIGIRGAYSMALALIAAGFGMALLARHMLAQHEQQENLSLTLS